MTPSSAKASRTGLGDTNFGAGFLANFVDLSHVGFGVGSFEAKFVRILSGPHP